MTVDEHIVPSRFGLEVRLGRDSDIEEWLATDSSLDRPVLVRVLIDADPARRQRFLESVRAAAAVPHAHIAHIFEAGDHGNNSYSVSEWAGGMTLADRTAAHEPVGSEEFLPNASGLASALAALHEAGAMHGAIDESAIFFSAAHPAKLAAFGRPPIALSPTDDTRMLAETLERSLTGRAAGSVSPSQVVDGVDATVDTALSMAQTDHAEAQVLASSLQGAPTPPRHSAAESNWSWRWLVPTAGLALVAVVLVSLGSSLVAGTSGDRNLPTPSVTIGSGPSASEPPATDETVNVDEPVQPSATETPVRAVAFDPFGSDGEHDELQDLVLDGDFETEWKTESYFDPLPRLKPGVGIAVEAQGSVGGVQVSGVRDGSQWSLLWAQAMSQDLDDWTLIANGTVRAGRFDSDVQVRQGGMWLIWFTDLPASNEGTFSTTVAEVRFRP